MPIIAPTNVIPGASALPLVFAGTPVDGTSGTFAGLAVKGQLLIDSVAGKLYINTNTLASPTWTLVGSQS